MKIHWIITMFAGHMDVQGADGLQALFTSNFPLLSAKSKWKGLQQAAGGRKSSLAVIPQAKSVHFLK